MTGFTFLAAVCYYLQDHSQVSNAVVKSAKSLSVTQRQSKKQIKPINFNYMFKLLE